jgi:hypothetical protein
MPRPRQTLTAFPELLRDWHPTKNGKLNPSSLTRGSGRPVWWLCAAGHEWRTSPAHRVYHHSGCPFCSGRKATPATSIVTLHPNLAREWHPTRNQGLSPQAVRPGSSKRIWWRCAKDPAHVWQAQVCTRALQATGCPHCYRGLAPAAPRQSLAATHESLCREWHPTKNRGLSPTSLTAATKTTVWWQCPKVSWHSWRAPVSRRAKGGAGCPFCRQPDPPKRIPLTKTGREYPVGARSPRVSWSELASKTFGIDVEECPRCRYTPMRVMAVVSAPTREQLEAVRHPGVGIAVVSVRSRAPPWSQQEFGFL